MDSQKLFSEKIDELEDLPERPKIFWYVSAGIFDYRGPVFLTGKNIEFMRKHRGRIFTKPDLFVFTSLGKEISELRSKLNSINEVLIFKDSLTSITANNYKAFGLQNFLELEISEDHIGIEQDDLPLPCQNAFYFEINIKHLRSGHSETQKILYLEHENIDTFNKVILKGYFDTVYLCAILQGWNCRRSIIEYIYSRKVSNNCFAESGFHPEFVIIEEGKRSFNEEWDLPGNFSVKKYYDRYPLKNHGSFEDLDNDRLHNEIYKFNYL